MTHLLSPARNGKHAYVRWTANERFQHWVLAVSFILLVFTGFALKHPDAWWVRPFISVPWFADARSLLHRIFGGAFVLVGVYHVFYLLATARGRVLGKAFLPCRRDLSDFMQNLSYYLGIRKQPPTFGHFNYMEKAEYLALIWGGVIMIVSGFMLWFSSLTLMFFPRWVIDLVTVVHLYEAWLASLAIVVWHFYSVIFDPEIYPINTCMVDGRISEKDQREHHFDEWLELQSEDGADAQSELSKQ